MIYGHQDLLENQFLDPNFHMYSYLKLTILTPFQPTFQNYTSVTLLFPNPKYYYSAFPSEHICDAKKKKRIIRNNSERLD